MIFFLLVLVFAYSLAAETHLISVPTQSMPLLWTLLKVTAIFRKQSQSGVPSIAAEILKYSYQTTIEIEELIATTATTLFIRKDVQ